MRTIDVVDEDVASRCLSHRFGVTTAAFDRRSLRGRRDGCSVGGGGGRRVGGNGCVGQRRHFERTESGRRFRVRHERLRELEYLVVQWVVLGRDGHGYLAGGHHRLGDGRQRRRALDQVALAELCPEVGERVFRRVRRKRRLRGQSGYRRVAVEPVGVQG